MLTQRSFKNRLWSSLAAGGLFLSTTAGAFASDCGCEVACTSCSVETSDCTCECSSPKKNKHNCLYRVLDAFAGGIEKVLRLDKCGCSDACDACCDATILSSPVYHGPGHHGPGHHGPGHHGPDHHGPHHHGPHHIDTGSAYPLHAPHGVPLHAAPHAEYSGPTREIELTPTGPSQWQPQPSTKMPMSDPRTQSSGQHLGGGAVIGGESTPPPAVRLPEPSSQPVPVETPAESVPDRESLFDTLDDPFTDDEARAHTYRPVRPSSYTEGFPRPAKRLPLSRSQSTSSRRVRSIR